jgi:cytochrome P450
MKLMILAAYTLQAAIFELLSHPSMYEKVKAEVIEALPNADEVVSFTQVENLPYLSAVIQETVRVHPGVVSRLPRVSPEVPIVYQDKKRATEYVIPPGTSANMTTHIAHMNADVFEDPYEFRPQRWIDNPRLDKGFIGFARGTRNCIGCVHHFTIC